METKTILMYEFSELSEDVQNELIEKNRTVEVEYDNWHEYIIEDFSDRMAKIGFKDIEVLFRGFYSQGDGASFTCKSVDTELLFKYLRKCKLLKGKVPYKDDLEISIKRTGHHYYHEYTVDANIDIDYNSNYHLRGNYDFAALEDIITKEVVQHFSREIYKDLRNEYNRLLSDQVVKDYLINRDDINYTIDGEQIPYSLLIEA
jgi:hypothetical protein